jgi:hypothetical protein
MRTVNHLTTALLLGDVAGLLIAHEPTAEPGAREALWLHRAEPGEVTASAVTISSQSGPVAFSQWPRLQT